MHEGHHGILDESNKEFEKKFGCTDCKSAQISHEHDHEHNHNHHHDHDHDHGNSDKTLKIVAGIIVGILAVFFLYWKFFK